MKVKDIKRWEHIILYDNHSLYGGLSYKETLGEFMASVNISPNIQIGKLNKILKECGIAKI